MNNKAIDPKQPTTPNNFLPLTLASIALGMGLLSWLGFQPFNLANAMGANPQASPTQATLVANPIGGKGTTVGEPNLVADVAEAIAPSVVNIDTQKTAKVRRRSGSPFQNDPFFQFFGMPEGYGDPSGGLPMRTPIMRGNGSGVILSADGQVLTNNHVIQGADQIVVTLRDGRKFDATVVGRDPMTDLAILKLKEAKNLTPAKLGDSSKLRPGEWVIAVGSPLGFDHTVTLGIVSALSRQVPDINSNVEFIQTDAAINPGNSGGPLVNLKGEVIGINTAIVGSGQNIGFAIPSSTVKRITQDLVTNGKVTRPWIGINMTNLSPELAQSLGLPENTAGIAVAQVIPGGPADKAGLVQGDIIQRVNGKTIASSKDMQDLVRSKPANSSLNLQILREGKMQAISVKTEILPEAALEKN